MSFNKEGKGISVMFMLYELKSISGIIFLTHFKYAGINSRICIECLEGKTFDQGSTHVFHDYHQSYDKLIAISVANKERGGS